MANRRFIDFPIATTVGDSDIILIWQSGVNKQTTKATFLSGLPENLDELNDVAISGLTNGQILRYDSVTGKWENTDQGNLDLNDLNDVSIVSPSNGQVLVYNSSTSKWENSSGGFVPYVGAVTTVNLGAQTIQAGQFVKVGGTASQFLKADGSIDSTAYGTGSVTSVGLTMPSAFNVANSPITTSGTLAVTGAGTVAQYIRGDGSLADFPEASGGGSSVSYYLNGSINQGTIGGVAYKELSKVPILGAGTDFTINANGYIASFITDAGDPNLLEIPAGNWNFETFFSASSGGGSPTFYVELYKYDGTTFTLIASNSTFPELIAFGTNVTAYFSTLAVPTTTLALTDRLAVRYYVTHSGRTIKLHTEDNHLCQIITTFTTGLTALNGLTAQVQNFATGTTGTDFNIASATATHTFNLPTASATNRGALSSTDWTTFNGKQNALTLTTTGSSGAATLVGSTLNIPNYSPDLSGYVPSTRTITINGTTQDLSANRTFNVGDMLLDTIQTVTARKDYNNNTLQLVVNGTSQKTVLTNSPIDSGSYSLAINAFGFNASNNLYFSKGGNNNGIFAFSNAATRTYTLKDASGTLAFTSDIPSLSGYVQGSGTTNYLPKFTGASTIGNSALYDGGGFGGFNSTGIAARTFVINAASGRPLALELIENSGVHAIYFRPNNSGFNLICSNYISGGVYLPLSLSARENSSDLVLATSGNLLVGTTTDNGARLQVSGAASVSGVGYFGGSSSLVTSIGILPTSANLQIFNGSAAINDTDKIADFILANNSSFTNGVIGRLIGFNSAVTSSDKRIAQIGFGLDGAINSGNINFSTLNAGTFATRLIIASTGAATFSSTLDAIDGIKVTNNNTSFFSAARFQLAAHNGSSVVVGGAIFQTSSASVYGEILGNQTNIYGSAANGIRMATANAPIIFATGNADSDFSTARMTITSSGNVLIGTTTDSGDKLRVNGNTFSNTIMTWNPENDNRSGIAWRLGGVSNASITPNRRLRVNVGGVEYYIGAVEV